MSVFTRWLSREGACQSAKSNLLDPIRLPRPPKCDDWHLVSSPYQYSQQALPWLLDLLSHWIPYFSHCCHKYLVRRASRGRTVDFSSRFHGGKAGWRGLASCCRSLRQMGHTEIHARARVGFLHSNHHNGRAPGIKQKETWTPLLEMRTSNHTLSRYHWVLQWHPFSHEAFQQSEDIFMYQTA